MFDKFKSLDRYVKIGLGIVGVVLIIALTTTGKNNTNNVQESSQTSAISQLLSKPNSPLPISVKNYQTTAQIPTNINIYSSPWGDEDIITIDISGLTYANESVDFFTNPEALAYADSYWHALSLLKEKGIKPVKKNLRFNQDKEQSHVANVWIATLNLND